MGERNFILNNMLCDRISITGTDMTRRGFSATSYSCKITPVFQNVSKSLNTVRLEMWFDGENKSMWSLYRLTF
jgi:hypothetical protein